MVQVSLRRCTTFFFEKYLENLENILKHVHNKKGFAWKSVKTRKQNKWYSPPFITTDYTVQSSQHNSDSETDAAIYNKQGNNHQLSGNFESFCQMIWIKGKFIPKNQNFKSQYKSSLAVTVGIGRVAIAIPVQWSWRSLKVFQESFQGASKQV